MARLLADTFERINGMITLQRRRGALPKVVQGGGLRLVHVSPIRKHFKKRPCFADVRPISSWVIDGPKLWSFEIFSPNEIMMLIFELP
jgi:hypothetical protein